MPPGRNRWLILAVLFIARTAMGYQFQSIAAISPFLRDALAIDFAAIGSLIGLYLLPGILFAIPGGLLGARFGDKRIVVGGLALMLFGGLLTGVSDGLALLAAGRLLSGVGAVLLNVLLVKMVADWFDGKGTVLAMAILLNSWPLGIGLALLTQGAIAAAAGWPVAVNAAAASCGVALLLVAATYTAPPRAEPVHSGSSLRGLSPTVALRVSFAGLVWALYNAGYIIVVSFAPTLLTERGMAASTAGLVASFATWSIIVSVPLGGLFVERFGRATAMISMCFFLMAAATLLVAFTGLPPLLTIALLGLVAGPPAGAIMALPAQVLARSVRAPGMGLFFTWYYVAMAVTPPVAGLARDASGAPAAPMVVAALLLLAAIAAMLAFRGLQARATVVAGSLR